MEVTAKTVFEEYVGSVQTIIIFPKWKVLLEKGKWSVVQSQTICYFNTKTTQC